MLKFVDGLKVAGEQQCTCKAQQEGTIAIEHQHLAVLKNLHPGSTVLDPLICWQASAAVIISSFQGMQEARVGMHLEEEVLLEGLGGFPADLVLLGDEGVEVKAQCAGLQTQLLASVRPAHAQEQSQHHEFAHIFKLSNVFHKTRSECVHASQCEEGLARDFNRINLICCTQFIAQS